MSLLSFHSSVTLSDPLKSFNSIQGNSSNLQLSKLLNPHNLPLLEVFYFEHLGFIATKKNV